MRMTPTATAGSWRSRLPLGVEGVLLLAGAVLLLLPYLWMLSTAVKSPAETFRLPLTLIPDSFHRDTFPRALTHFAFPTYILNSLIVASAVTVSSVVRSSMAGYAFTRFTFPGRELLFLFMLTTLMLPTEVVLVPQFLVVHALGWLNSYQGLIIPTALDAFAIFLMRQFLLSFPKELIDAARVDGAGEFTIYSRIVLPNLKPAIAAIAVFSFRDSWDQYIWPLVIVSRDAMKTFPIGVAQLESEAVGGFNEQMAIAAIGM